jgi:ParB/RepB/Spo0J family partition protein
MPTDPDLMKFDPQLIDASPYQPRRIFDPVELGKLAESVKEIGLIQPLVARLSKTEGRLELVVGERRLRACKIAGLTLVPVLLRDLTDLQAEQMTLEENIQRKDLSLSEEGFAFKRMMEMRNEEGAQVYTQASIAAFIHEDVEYVKARLRLVACPEELIAAVDSKVVAISVALLVGGVPDAKARALAAKEVLTPELIDQEVPLNFAQTREMIREHFCIRLDAKNFDLEKALLVPVQVDEVGQRCLGGACSDCPFRSGNLEGAQIQTAKAEGNDKGKKKGSAGGVDANLCTLPKCYKMKLRAVWDEEKRDAQRAGRKTLEGAAAEEVFAGLNGQLAHDSGLTTLENAKQVAKARGAEWKALNIPVIVALHPETLTVHELVDWKKAYPAICAAESARLKEEKGKPKTGAQLKEEAAESERKQKEAAQEKLDKLTVSEGLTEIVNHITGKGMDLEFLDLIFQLALDASGADGMYCMGKWLEIKLPKGTAHSGRDYEEDILKILRERCQTSNAWLAYTAIALIAWDVKVNGLESDDFAILLKRCGLKVDELKRRAKALMKGPAKAKGEAPAAGTLVKNSTDDSNWTADGVASTTAAADVRAKGTARGAKHGTSANAEDYAKAAAKKAGCKDLAEAGEFDAAVTRIQAGEGYPDVLGPRPGEGTKERKKWEAAKVRIWKEVKKRNAARSAKNEAK